MKIEGSELAGPELAGSEPKSAVESRRLFRRRPLLVEAIPQPDGSWAVSEAGIISEISGNTFPLLYEAVSVEAGKAVDVGLPDMAPGSEIEHDGRRLVRVEVIAGRGAAAYWYRAVPCGQDCGFRVVADMTVDPSASHYAGRFLEAWEGGVVKRTWVVAPARKK